VLSRFDNLGPFALVAPDRMLHLMGFGQVDWGDLANKIKTSGHNPIRSTCSPTASSTTVAPGLVLFR
jgi:hypothetical protein